MELPLLAMLLSALAVTVGFLIITLRHHRSRRPTPLAHKHVLITGASSGIGFALAKLCLSHGAYVTLVARSPSRLSRAAQALLGKNVDTTTNPDPRIRLQAVDVSDAVAIASTIEESFRWRPIDILICNAGVSIPGYLDAMKLEDLDSTARINLLGCVYPVHAVLPLMKSRSRHNPSSIVFVSSLSGLCFLYESSLYTSTKYALKGLAEVLRLELMPHNISVHLVCPGFTETPMLDTGESMNTKLLEKLSFYDRQKAEPADDVARKALEGITRGDFLITTSHVGFIIGVLARGCVPAQSLGIAIVELVLLVPLRLVSFVWYFYIKHTIKHFHDETS